MELGDCVIINLWFDEIRANVADGLRFLAWADRCQIDGNTSLRPHIPAVLLTVGSELPWPEYEDFSRKMRTWSEDKASLADRMNYAPAVLYQSLTPTLHLRYSLRRNPDAAQFLLAAAYSGKGCYMQVVANVPHRWNAAKAMDEPLIFDRASLSSDTSLRDDRKDRPVFPLKHGY